VRGLEKVVDQPGGSTLLHGFAGSGSYVRCHIGIVCSAVFGLREDCSLERRGVEL